MGHSLQLTAAPVAGSFLVDSVLHRDNRGFFGRAWCLREFADAGIHFIPVQANIGSSPKRGTLRGMHFQIPPAPEAKLVRCTRGSLFDVLIDMRPDSPTYLRWYGAEITAENCRMLYIPEGCAHGYQTLESNTDLYYMTSQFFTPSAARGVRFDDPAFAIGWPLPPTIISEQDRNWPLIRQERVL